MPKNPNSPYSKQNSCGPVHVPVNASENVKLQILASKLEAQLRDEFVLKETLKTINSESLLGGGNIDITSITKIEKTASEGLIDTYTIYFNNTTEPFSFNIKNGEKGDKGDKGEKGDKGDKGDQGIQGPQGEKGDKGDTGEKGDKGDKGDAFVYEDFTADQLEALKVKGDKGDTGDQGPKGNDGYTPIKGVDYFDGEKGEKGDTGATGPKGDKGDTGEKGDKGDKGDALTYDMLTDSQKAELKGQDGYTPIKGIDYFDGEKGDQGPQGPKGETGATGAAFTYEMFTTEQLKGLVGPQGETGTQGEPGKDFTYDMFTEEQLAALKGEKGDTGEAGMTISLKVGENTYSHEDGIITLPKYITEEELPEIEMPELTLSGTVTKAVGGIAAGKSYESTSILEVLNDLLFPYVAPVFNSISTNEAAGTFEYGTTKTISKVTPNFTKGSKAITSIKIGTSSEGSDLYEGTTATSGSAITLTTSKVFDGTTGGTIYCTISDGTSSVSKSASVNYTYYNYTTVTSSTEIPTVATSNGTNAEATITTQDNTYIWFLIPNQNKKQIQQYSMNQWNNMATTYVGSFTFTTNTGVEKEYYAYRTDMMMSASEKYRIN